MTDEELKFWEECFKAWMVKVDSALVNLVQMDSGDLPDWNYAEAFDDGRLDFKQIARDVLTDGGYGSYI